MVSSYTGRLGNAPEEGIKAPTVVATQAPITLSGEQTIETIDVVEGDRVLVRAQADTTENGIYNAAGGAWTRTVDWNAANDVINGVLVNDASTAIIYQASLVDPFTPDVTPVTFPAWSPIAGDVPTDNSNNELSATDVQASFDEIGVVGPQLVAASATLYAYNNLG